MLKCIYIERECEREREINIRPQSKGVPGLGDLCVTSACTPLGLTPLGCSLILMDVERVEERGFNHATTRCCFVDDLLSALREQEPGERVVRFSLLPSDDNQHTGVLWMPVVKRKHVQPVSLPASLAAAHAQHEDRDVFYLAATGEVFDDYEYV